MMQKDVSSHAQRTGQRLGEKQSWEASSDGDSRTIKHHQNETEADQGGEDLISF